MKIIDEYHRRLEISRDGEVVESHEDDVTLVSDDSNRKYNVKVRDKTGEDFVSSWMVGERRARREFESRRGLQEIK